MSYSSYTYQTTHNILRGLKVKLPHEAIAKVIQQHRHIYHLICQLTTLHLYNSLVLEHCRELDEYAQEDIFTRLHEQHAKNSEEEEDSPQATNQLDLFFQRAGDRLAQLTELLTQANEHSQQQYAKIQKICSDELEQWTQLQKQQAQQIKQALEQASLTPPTCFTKKLTELLIHQGITATIPSSLTTGLSHFNASNFVHCCTVAALACDNTHEPALDSQWVDQVLATIENQTQQASQQSIELLEQFAERINRYRQIIQDDYQQILMTDADLLKLANEVREAKRKYKERLKYGGANIDSLLEDDHSEEITPFSRATH